MGTVKRKVRRKSSKGYPIDVLVEAREEVNDRIGELVALLRGIKTKGQVAQSVLAACMLLDQLEKEVKAAHADAKEALKAHHNAGGSFAIGRIAIAFPVVSRRAVAWKPEAIRLSAVLAETQGMKFDEKAYADGMLKSCTPSVSTGVKLVESAG